MGRNVVEWMVWKLRCSWSQITISVALNGIGKCVCLCCCCVLIFFAYLCFCCVLWEDSHSLFALVNVSLSDCTINRWKTFQCECLFWSQLPWREDFFWPFWDFSFGFYLTESNTTKDLHIHFFFFFYLLLGSIFFFFFLQIFYLSKRWHQYFQKTI